MTTGGSLGLELAAIHKGDDWRESGAGVGDHWRESGAGAGGNT